MPRERGPTVHGTRYAYYGWAQCRCETCRDAVAKYQRGYRDNHPEYRAADNNRRKSQP